jgi:hypothetical protein
MRVRKNCIQIERFWNSVITYIMNERIITYIMNECIITYIINYWIDLVNSYRIDFFFSQFFDCVITYINIIIWKERMRKQARPTGRGCESTLDCKERMRKQARPTGEEEWLAWPQTNKWDEEMAHLTTDNGRWGDGSFASDEENVITYIIERNEISQEWPYFFLLSKNERFRQTEVVKR